MSTITAAISLNGKTSRHGWSSPSLLKFTLLAVMGPMLLARHFHQVGSQDMEMVAQYTQTPLNLTTAVEGLLHQLATPSSNPVSAPLVSTADWSKSLVHALHSQGHFTTLFKLIPLALLLSFLSIISLHFFVLLLASLVKWALKSALYLVVGRQACLKHIINKHKENHWVHFFDTCKDVAVWTGNKSWPVVAVAVGILAFSCFGETRL
ncbi:hypothetical protein T439DRAFT_352339 [Meredithblackwellia eburnea MCA 4105]